MDTYADWLDARENARTAIEDFKAAANAAAANEAYYYKCKSIETARMKANGDPATYISMAIKGVDVVNDALYAKLLSEAEMAAAKMASQLYIQEEAHCYDLHKRVMAGDSERF